MARADRIEGGVPSGLGSVARIRANTNAVGQASKKIQAIADVRKTADVVGADKKITNKVIKQMRQGKRPETATNHQPRIGGHAN